jgi:uncharacterized protein (TIGR02145 family)
MTAGVAVSGVTQTITATVTTVGTYSISTTVNGVTFAGSGTFAATGAQDIVLTASGTPTATGTSSFTLNTTPNCNFSRTVLANPSSNGTAVVSGYSCSTASAGMMTAGVAVSGVTRTITATVTTVGTYSISTTANGVTFAGAGTFAGTGAQNIVLTATGTPIASGFHSFTLNTTPNCSFTRAVYDPGVVLAPLPANITLSAISPYLVASVYDQDYLPYTVPTGPASLATAQAADGINEATSLNIQGSLTTTGVTLKIPYTVVTAAVSLPAFSQTFNVPASFTEDNVARDVTFSYAAASLAVGSGTIDATLKAEAGTLSAKQLDIQTGIGNDNLGWLLAQFTYALNSSGGSANFDFRNIAAIPDRNYDAAAAYRMLYLPVLGAGNRMWLNNNLGADYANTTKASFNPAKQATASNDQNAYGSRFQWGRGADGHELINWTGSTAGTAVNGTTSTLSTTDIPGNSNFITTSSGVNDWRNPQNVNLWQGVNGVNNPCPSGYRLPTAAEWTTELNSWSPLTSVGAFTSSLKLPAPGYRNEQTGTLPHTGSFGHYWSSTVNGTNSSGLYYGSFVSQDSPMRARGQSVRCIAAGHPSTDGTAVVSGYSCSTASAGSMTAGVAVSGVTQTITATVTTVGTYIITATANGVTFAGSGTFAGTGAQNIVLIATGTPTASDNHSFTLNTTPNCSFNRFVNDPSSNGTAVVSAYTCSTASAGTMTAGVAVSGVTQTITATVTTVGTYSISTTANGVTFAASGTFAGIGAQDIVLAATGTPTAATASPYSYTLNTTPNCNFTRVVLAPLPGNITLSAISPYFVASVYDQDYLPYTAPTGPASLATAQAANGVNEANALNIQGILTTTGVTLKIPYTVVTASVSLPAYSQTINVPASYTEDGIARDVTFSHGAASLAVGSGTINATLQAVGGTLNAKKLDLQTGIGNDNLGWLLAQFTYATNNSGGTANFDFRDIAPIPDRNIADANHVMFYLPVLGADGRTWLNNNLGANYANTTNGAFNPAAQASATNDANAYGSLFQWGRYADGHEFRNSANTAGPIATPWTSINFITNSTDPRDWRNPQNDNLWQGVSGTNNPCPIGYRLPTETELNNQRLTWSSNTSSGAIASPLKLPLASFRVSSSGSLGSVGTNGYYWSTTVSGAYARSLYFDSSSASMSALTYRAGGISIRCIMD